MVANSRKELLYLVEDRVLVTDERKVVVAGKLDILRARNVPRHETCAADIDVAVAHSVNDQRWDPYRRKDMPDVDLSVHVAKRKCGTRTGAHAQVCRPPLPE